MYNGYLFTVENVRKALHEYDYERYNHHCLGWCIERTQHFTDEQLEKGLSKIWALDLIYSVEEIIRALCQPENEIISFIRQSEADSYDLAIAATAMAGALLSPEQNYLVDTALLRLSAEALLANAKHGEVMNEFEDLYELEKVRKRSQSGGLKRAEKLYGALRLQCRKWASVIIERNRDEGRKALTKSGLALLVDKEYHRFIREYPNGSSEYLKLHPPGCNELSDGAALSTGAIYKWVKDMVEGQTRSKKPLE